MTARPPHVAAASKVLKRPARLRDMARDLELEAQWLRKEAVRMEERAAREDEIKRRKAAIRRAAQACAQGEQIASAARRLAVQLNLSEPDARFIIADTMQRYHTIGRTRRNREILRRAQRGWTNAELGAYYNLHPKHVSRLIQRALKWT